MLGLTLQSLVDTLYILPVEEFFLGYILYILPVEVFFSWIIYIFKVVFVQQKYKATSSMPL